jgi:hypothetical protein
MRAETALAAPVAWGAAEPVWLTVEPEPEPEPERDEPVEAAELAEPEAPVPEAAAEETAAPGI